MLVLQSRLLEIVASLSVLSKPDLEIVCGFCITVPCGLVLQSLGFVSQSHVV
jgi:hypothetical protein